MNQHMIPSFVFLRLGQWKPWDWKAAWGHPLKLKPNFCPWIYPVPMYPLQTDVTGQCFQRLRQSPKPSLVGELRKVKLRPKQRPKRKPRTRHVCGVQNLNVSCILVIQIALFSLFFELFSVCLLPNWCARTCWSRKFGSWDRPNPVYSQWV